MTVDCYETELLEIFIQENIDYYAVNPKLIIDIIPNINLISNETKIPLNTHQIYLSSLANPQKMDAINLRKTLSSLKLLNEVSKDWKHYIWTNNVEFIPTEILAIPGIEVHLIDELISSIIWDELTDIIAKVDSDKSMYVKASDLIRYSALEIFGGIYRDLDYEIYKPEEFLKLLKNFHFFGGKEFAYDPSYMGSALIGSVADHPVIKIALSLIKRNLSENNLPQYLQYPCDKVNKQMYETGPAVITFSFFKAANQEGYLDALLESNILFNWDYARSTTPDSPCYKANPNLALNNKTIGADMFCGAWHSNKAANPRFYYLKNVNSYLYLAAQNGDVAALQLNINNGADINFIHPDTKATALHIAAQNGHKELVELLIKEGADLEIPTPNGATALYTAIAMNHPEIVAFLVKAGAIIKSYMIEKAKNLGILSLLSTKGVDLTELGCYQGDLIDIFEQEGINYKLEDKKLIEHYEANKNITSNLNPIPFKTHQIYFAVNAKPIDKIFLDKTIITIKNLNAENDSWEHNIWTNDANIIPRELSILKGMRIRLVDELKAAVLYKELKFILIKAALDKSLLTQASDLARLMVLFAEGGLYRDLDNEIYRAKELIKMLLSYNFVGGKERGSVASVEVK
jgi:hypothetical protein